MKSVKNQVWDQVRNQVWDQVEKELETESSTVSINKEE